MAPATLQARPAGRLRWALREGLIIAGILLFWTGVAVVLVGFLSAVSSVLHFIGLRPFYQIAELLERSMIVWPAFSTIAILTAGLYTVVRAGTLLLDHHQPRPGIDASRRRVNYTSIHRRYA
ncbi:MAG: hypothetical protein ABEH59_06810 [Halobacteriales archaeon]